MSKSLNAATAIAGAALLVGLPVAAHASPQGAGCPGGNSGFSLWDTSAEPYQVDNRVDAAGNQDDLVCAKPIYVTTDGSGQPFQIYNFLDNSFR